MGEICLVVGRAFLADFIKIKSISKLDWENSIWIFRIAYENNARKRKKTFI